MGSEMCIRDSPTPTGNLELPSATPTTKPPRSAPPKTKRPRGCPPPPSLKYLSSKAPRSPSPRPTHAIGDLGGGGGLPRAEQGRGRGPDPWRHPLDQRCSCCCLSAHCCSFAPSMAQVSPRLSVSAPASPVLAPSGQRHRSGCLLRVHPQSRAKAGLPLRAALLLWPSHRKWCNMQTLPFLFYSSVESLARLRWQSSLLLSLNGSGHVAGQHTLSTRGCCAPCKCCHCFLL